jgi:uncharacterized protein YbaR (Trm112 family)
MLRLMPTLTTMPTDLLICTACRGELNERPDSLLCDSCGRTYPIRDGVPNLLKDKPTNGLDVAPGLLGQAIGAVVRIPHAYDVVQRLAGADETLGRIRRALADSAGEVVLDVGAGTGAVEAALPAGARYLWLDADPQKLEGFRARSASPAILGNATNLPLADESVDWAVSVGVSHHLDDGELGLMLDFVDAVRTPTPASRLLWRYDRGRHARPAVSLWRELDRRFDVVAAEEFRLLHRYLLVKAV